MGKRQHKRHNINHPAILTLENGVKLDCRIRNFSYGGLFLIASDGNTPHIAPGEPATIRIANQKDAQVIHTRIAHASAGGLGVAFGNREDGLLRHLHAIAATAGSQQIRTGTSGGGGGMGTREIAITNWIHAATKRFLRSRYPEFIQAACSILFDAANNADNNQTQRLLFDAYNILRKNQKEIEGLFLDNIDHRFSKGLSNDIPAKATPQHAEMELVAKEDFEEWVVVIDLTRSLEAGLSSKLQLLENSLSFLTKTYIDNEKNPVSPYSLLWSFKKSLARLEIALAAKRLIFSSFHNNMMKNINALYDEINLYLDKQGITGQAQDKAPGKQQRPAAPQPGANSRSPRTRKTLTDTLSSLIGFAGDKPAPQGYMPDAGEVASKDVIVRSLANISTAGHRPIIQKIEEQLSSQTANGRPRVVDTTTRKTIQVTEQLLGSLQQDSFINQEIRGLIDSLKIPLVKEAINNPALLNDASHPGHKLLDTIGRLGPYIQADEQSRPGKGYLYQAIEEVNRLAEQGAQLDIKQITDHLEKIIDQRKQHLKSNLGLVTESCEQEERYQAAKDYVFRLLCSKLTNGTIPVIVEQLLYLGWGGLLVHAISTYGENDKNAIRLAGVIDLFLDIFNTGQGVKPVADTQKDYLVKVVKGGFSQYPLYADEAGQYLARLEAILGSGEADQQEIAKKRVRLDHTHIKQLLDEQTAPQTADIPNTDIEHTWLDLVSSIKLDDWIVEQRQRGHARMLNLAWKNTSATRYVFVDGEGTKRLDTGNRNLANMFRQNHCSLLEDGNIPIVERAVDRILKNTFEQIKKDSDTDSLTGLLSHNAFQKKISEVLEITNDFGDQHILLKLNIDKFSMINEQCGPMGGDRLLQTISSIISNYLPEDTTLARVGSDEFAALIKDCSLDEGYHIAETQRRAIANLRFTWDGTATPTTASVGIVHIDSDVRSAAEAMNMASSACQTAIEDGGNCTRIYQPTDQDIAKRQGAASEAHTIEGALKDQNLSLYAQPISTIFLGDGEEQHYEILLRVKNKDNVWEGPDDFIHAAEKCDRMRSVDRWVINKLFSWLKNHHQELGNIGISINLSAQTMDDESFYVFISNHLDSSPFPCDRISFEITESSLIKHIDKAKSLVEKIRRKGCKFSLDDFGTGYASYSYLKDFPVDHVKIDGSFIRDILTDSSSQAMVKSITEISHHMGKKVVAEYVENEATLVALRELEVDFAQGHYIGHPVPLKNLLRPGF